MSLALRAGKAFTSSMVAMMPIPAGMIKKRTIA
jgi:hypothetical protein